MTRTIIAIAGGVAAVLAASTARAQPVTSPDAIPPLAQIHDDKQLAEIIASITQDPAIRVDDDKARAAAQALMTEGVRRLQVQSYDQALANFLEAYNKFPSPKILLNIASTLRDMGRTADAANTYQRYLTDPATGAERVAEVKELLIKLDAGLTILTVHVFPRGSELSIDGGPWVPVGSSLQTRVRPGPHTVRIRHTGIVTSSDLTTFDGEMRDVNVQITNDVKSEEPPPTTPPPPPATASPPPENGQGWLIGRTYATADGNSRQRRTLETPSGPEVKPIVTQGSGDIDVGPYVPPADDKIGSGVVGIIRIDGNHWRGFAGGLGLAYAVTDPVELEVAGLKSDVWGAYLGGRYRFLTGWLRPYAAAGVPMFFFTADDGTAHAALGARIAGGIELKLNGHLSLEADVGIEYFFNISGVVYKMQTFEDTAFTPTIGAIGRL